MEKNKKLVSDQKKELLNLNAYQHHVIFCGGPSCYPDDQGEVLWKYLKDRLESSGLTKKGDAKVFRTRAKCLRVCADGPIAVVYPEGTWYRMLDQSAIDLIIDEHLIHGRPVAHLAFAHNAMCQTETR